MNKSIQICITCLFCISLLAACHEESQAESPTQVKGNVTGIVEETMNAGGYTYALINNNGDKKWVAGPKTSLSVGDNISLLPPMPMENFKSTALNREFEIIYFTSGFNPGNTVAVKKDSSTSKNPHAANTETPNSHVKPEAGAANNKVLTGIKKAKNGKTVDEVLKQKQQLKGKSVVIRGKVVKFTSDVLDKNWIHIKDSSGSGDLTITTTTKVKLGDIILAKGKISVKKDFGYGYIYDVILEDAKITIE